MSPAIDAERVDSVKTVIWLVPSRDQNILFYVKTAGTHSHSNCV